MCKPNKAVDLFVVSVFSCLNLTKGAFTPGCVVGVVFPLKELEWFLVCLRFEIHFYKNFTPIHTMTIQNELPFLSDVIQRR